MDRLLSKDKYVYYLCFLLDPQHRELSILSQPEFTELRAALPDPPLTQQQEFVQHIFEPNNHAQQTVNELRTNLPQHFPIQQFLDTLEKHDMTLPELYIQDNYWLESHQCHGKGCQELSLHNLNQGQFLCDAMHTYKDHECVQNIRAIMEDMIKESLARRKIKLLEKHAATQEEIDGYLERVSSVEEFQKLSEKEKQGFISFFRNQPTPTDTVKKIFYDSDDDDDDDVGEKDRETQEESPGTTVGPPGDDQEDGTTVGPPGDQEDGTTVGPPGDQEDGTTVDPEHPEEPDQAPDKKRKKTGGGCRHIKDDDVILQRVLPKMMKSLSSLPMSLGLTARQVIRGMEGLPTWKERVFSSVPRYGGGGVEDAMKHDDAWWSQLHTPQLQAFQQELDQKLRKCKDGECEPWTKMLDRVHGLLLKKALKKEEKTSEQQEETEEQLIEQVLEPLEEKGKSKQHIKRQLEETRQDVRQKKDELHQVKSEIQFYETSIKTEHDAEERKELQSLLEEAREEEKDLQKEVEFLQKQEADLLVQESSSTTVLAKQANEKFKHMTGVDFQKNLADALDERIGENNGVIMTMYLKTIVYLRRKIRNWAEQLVPAESREKHWKNIWDKDRTWASAVKNVGSAAWSAVTLTSNNSTLFIMDAMYMIAKNQYLMMGCLAALKQVKKRLCRTIQMQLFTVEIDATQMTSKEIAAQLATWFRKYTPTRIIPAGNEMIQTGMEGTKLLLNMAVVGEIPWIGSALNSVVFMIVLCAKDAYEEMCAANFIMTAAEDLVETLDWFHCFKEPFTEKLNQSWFGIKDKYLLWDMNKYYVSITPTMAPDGWAGEIDRDYHSTVIKYRVEDNTEFSCTLETGSGLTHSHIARTSSKVSPELIKLAVANYQKNNTTTKAEDIEKYREISFEYSAFGVNTKRFKSILEVDDSKVLATQRNIDLMYILLADDVLHLANIQPPSLILPLGHWIKSQERKKRDESSSRLLHNFCYNGADGKVLDFYSAIPTSQSQRHIFDMHMSNLKGKSAREKTDRELSKKYIQNYDSLKHDGNVFVMKHDVVTFVDSTYRLKNESTEEPDVAVKAGGGKTFSWSSRSKNNLTRKIIL